MTARRKSLLTWLRAMRIHTASLTIPGALLGVAVGGGGPWWLWLGVASWALLYHGVGFLHNNLCDLEADRRDPAKRHFPLVTGEIAAETARLVVVAGTCLGIVLGWVLAFGNWFALLAILLAVFFGFLYNLTSKRTLRAPLYISAAFAVIPLYGYFAAAGPVAPSLPAWLVFWYGFFLMFYQIAVSGYLKEVAQEDQPNLLRRTSWRVETVTLYGLQSQASVGYMGDKGFTIDRLRRGSSWPYFARLPTVAIGFGIMVSLGVPMASWENWPIALPYVGLTALLLQATEVELRGGPFDRPRRVRMMAVVEILAYWSLVVALLPLLGWAGGLAFAIAPLAWFVLWNRILWGTWVGPRV